jgi:hypothetical protein
MNFILLKNINNFYKAILLLQLSLCFSLNTVGQKSGIDTLVKRFDSYRKSSLQEKLYVHLDKSYYLTGEILWFKVYNVDATFHKPLDISKVAYLEILSSENHPVLQAKVALINGSGDGSIFLPVSINSGNYQVRAYTNWMKNFEPEGYFRTSISIVNTFKEPEKPATTVERYDAQFFPEGGNLVGGLKSRVAFRVINSDGVGIEFKGEIFDQNRNVVASFKPHKFGIGNFSFTPSANQTYTAVITDTKGSINTYKLPVVNEKGYVMSVQDSTGSQIIVTVQKIGREDDTIVPFVYVIVNAQHMITTAVARVIQNGKASFQINKKDLSEGISQVTLFNDKFQPVAERLFFKTPEKKLEIKIQTDQLLYGRRKKVRLDINSQNSIHRAESANASIAITRNDSLSSLEHDNILTYLLFTSELRGRIESPAYYFQAQDGEALDNLLLTHGWRRFSWKDIMDSKKLAPADIPEYGGHIINGRIIDESGNPIPGVITYLSSPGKSIQLYTCRSNEQGRIQFDMNYFFGAKKLIAQAEPGKIRGYRMEMKDPFSEKFATYLMPVFLSNPQQEKEILLRSVATQAQDIYQSKNINKFSNPTLDSVSFYGKADETYILSDYTRFPTMEDVLREYVPGVLVRKRKDNFYFRIPDNLNKTIFKDNPLVLLDGLPVFDLNKIMAFDPLKVRKLEVMTRRYYLGYSSFPGMVSYTTYRGDLGGFELDPQCVSLDYEGLQQHREFYSPKYETQKQIDSRIPDQRNLLYWNPSVITDKKGKYQIEFYTSDLDGDFEITVEGITKNGLAGSARSTFRVNKGN